MFSWATQLCRPFFIIRGGFMKRLLKVKAACALLAVGSMVFAQEVNLNVESAPKIEAGTFTKMKNAGTGMIIGGAVLGTFATVMGATHFVEADDHLLYTDNRGNNHFASKSDEDKFNKEVGKGAGWIVGASLAYSAVLAGIPIRIVGRVKAEELQKAVPTAAYIVPNGVKFTWDF
jgi:hypothetical protein